MSKKDVAVLLGTGSIGQAIVRRVGAGKHIVLADLKLENAERAAKILEDAGFETSVISTDLGSREAILKLVEHAQQFGEIKNLINAAGVSPSQASVQDILRVDLYGTAVLLEEFGKIISDTLKAYQYSKRCNVLRVMYEATRWGKRGATINSISPGIIITPLANDELHGPRAEGYLKMLRLCPAGRAGTPDEVGDLAEFLMSSRGRWISGSDFLIDGGTTASYWYGDLQYLKATH